MLKRDMQVPLEISRKLEELGIATLYLFGSRAQGLSSERSDYDFGVLLQDPSVLRDGSQEMYQRIYDLLQDLVPRKVDMDIVFLDRAPLQLKYHVIRHGKVLLDNHPTRRGRFEETTLEEHADFEPYRQMFEQATLARIS